MPIYVCAQALAADFKLRGRVFVGGYLLQFAGHLLEGTDPGEIILGFLQPGHSFTLGGTWNGVSNVENSPPNSRRGTFTVTNQLDPTERLGHVSDRGSAIRRSSPDNSAGFTGRTSLTGDSGLAATTATSRACRRLCPANRRAEPDRSSCIHFTFTLTNSGSEAIDLSPSSLAASFTLRAGICHGLALDGAIRSFSGGRDSCSGTEHPALRPLAGQAEPRWRRIGRPGFYRLVVGVAGDFSATAAIRLAR